MAQIRVFKDFAQELLWDIVAVKWDYGNQIFLFIKIRILTASNSYQNKSVSF